MDALIKGEVREDFKVRDYLRLDMGAEQRHPYSPYTFDSQKVSRQQKYN